MKVNFNDIIYQAYKYTYGAEKKAAFEIYKEKVWAITENGFVGVFKENGMKDTYTLHKYEDYGDTWFTDFESAKERVQDDLDYEVEFVVDGDVIYCEERKE